MSTDNQKLISFIEGRLRGDALCMPLEAVEAYRKQIFEVALKALKDKEDVASRYDFDAPALEFAEKIMECRATAAEDGWPDGRLKAAIQCLVIDAMKWVAPVAQPLHPLLTGVEWPHRRIIYVIEDPQRGDKRFIKDLEAAVLEQFEATTKANKNYSFGRNIADDSPMTDDQLADEARLTANPFQASNGVTVTWINATQYEPLKPAQHHNGMMQLSHRLAEAETARNDLWEELKRLRAQEPTYQLCMNPRSVAAQWLDVTKEQYEISDQKKRIVYNEARPAADVVDWADGLLGYDAAPKPDMSKCVLVGAEWIDVNTYRILPPEGWKLVPVEPTQEMLEEIWLTNDWKEAAIRSRYAALLAAAPAPGGDDA